MEAEVGVGRNQVGRMGRNQVGRNQVGRNQVGSEVKPMHLNSLYTFNTVATKRFTSAVQSENGISLLVDTSASMKNVEIELRLAFSAAIALSSNIAQKFSLPVLENSTYIVTGLEAIFDEIKNTRVVMITDGEDTEFTRTVIPKRLPNGEIGSIELGKGDRHQRREAVLHFLTEVLNCNVHLVGIGAEVKDFVKLACRNPKIVVGHIETGTPPNEIVGTFEKTIGTTAKNEIFCKVESDNQALIGTVIRTADELVIGDFCTVE